jgi:hypothetical protein
VLIDSLGRVSGQFEQEQSGQWGFASGVALFEAIGTFGDSAVSRLVACIDDLTPAAALLRNRPVARGVMCYQALRHVAYAEPEGSDTGEWPGVVSPTATANQLRAAKRAWTDIVRARSYRFN